MSDKSANNNTQPEQVFVANDAKILTQYDGQDQHSIDFSNQNPHAISDIFTTFSGLDADKNMLSKHEFQAIFKQRRNAQAYQIH
ncbi:MAG: hypothetical protein ACJAQ0_000401 [Dasania sp.]|jgi:hypothetical protein